MQLSRKRRFGLWLSSLLEHWAFRIDMWSAESMPDLDVEGAWSDGEWEAFELDFLRADDELDLAWKQEHAECDMNNCKISSPPLPLINLALDRAESRGTATMYREADPNASWSLPK